MFPILKRPSFLKKYITRFKKILCIELISLIAERTIAKFVPFVLPVTWCMFRDYLPSGHCCACLTNPYLLLYHPNHVNCFCIDHLRFWNMNIIIWNKDCDFEHCNVDWPNCECSKFK